MAVDSSALSRLSYQSFNRGIIDSKVQKMDVDLLRPGTVPISPDTVLWFEFLLNEDLLLKHLQKPTCGTLVC